MTSLELELETLAIVFFLVIVFSGFEVFQMMVSDIHSSSNKAKSSVKSTMRVTGVVLMVTGMMALGLCLIGLLDCHGN